MTFEIALLLVLIVASLVLFSLERIPPDVVALGLVLALVFTGLLPPKQAFDGFGSDTVIMILGLLLLTAALMRTGVMDMAGAYILHYTGTSPARLLIVIMLGSAAVGAFMSNTASTAFFLPIVIGLAPGVLIGTALVSQVNPGWLKFGTFVVLLPLILVQAAGYRRPIRSERSVGFAFGGGVGVLYSVTTISGPPLAVMLSNQGLTKTDFRAALGFIRLAESSLTAIAYYYAGLYSLESMGLIPYIVPSIAVGVPLGAVLIQKIRPETFRRICMSFDAWIVAFGLSTLLKDLHLVEGNRAYLVLLAVGMLDTWLLYRFFSVHLPMARQAEFLATTERTGRLQPARAQGDHL